MMFPSNQWKGLYKNGNELFKIAVNASNHEMLIVYIQSDHGPPSLVRGALKI